MLTAFFSNNLEVVFFIYGLAFFVMGVMVFAKPKMKSEFKLAIVVWLLAGFGIIHGINEWLDMAVIIIKFSPKVLTVARLTALMLSFIFLFEFGRRLIRLSNGKFLSKGLLAIFCLLTLILIFVSKHEQSIWIRYFIGFPGSIMTAIGFMFYYRANEKELKLFKVYKYFFTAAVAMGVYGILGGLIVPPAGFFPASLINNISFLNLVGIPVQVFRAICASIIAWAVWNIMSIFDSEVRIMLKNRLAAAIAAKRYSDSIIEAMSDALLVVSPEGKIKAVNGAARDLAGYQDEEIIDQPVRQILAGVSFGNREVKNIQAECLTKDKGRVPILVSHSTIQDNSGNITGIVYIAKDLREIKGLKEHINAIEKLAAIGRAAGIIGHEFRNQLGVMESSIYFLKTKLQTKDEKVKTHLARLEHEVAETNRIIENILTFSKDKQLELNLVDIGELLTSAVKKTTSPEGITVIVRIAPDLPKVRGNSIQLSLVFVNILLNAIQAISKNGQVTVQAKQMNSSLQVDFEDTGSGIKEEVLKRVFEPFFSNKSRGTGLGLYISKSVIEAHHGTITIDSKVGQGTKVTIKLPVEGKNGEKA